MRPIISQFVCLCALLGFGVSAVVAETLPRTWTVHDVSGTVDIKTASGREITALAGTHLETPFTIVTGESSRAVVMHGQDKLTVAANSQTTVPQPQPSRNGLITRIKQAIGSVLYHAQHRVNGGFEVDTPYLVSVVKGTTFNIHVTADATSVALVEGRLLVYTPDKQHEVTLTPGQVAIKSKKSKGIILKDQKTLSDSRQGPIMLDEDGKRAVQLRSGTQDGVKLGDNLTGGTLNTGVNVPGVSAGASISGGGISGGTSLSGVSAGVSVGSGGVSAGVSVPGVSASTSTATDVGGTITKIAPTTSLP